MQQPDKTDAPLTLADIAEPSPGSAGGGTLAFRLRRVFRKILYKALPRKMTRRVVRGGLRYELNGKDFILRRLLVSGYYEPDQIEFFFNAAARRGADLFLDVGANFGYYSLLAARLGIFDEIHAFEPQPQTYQKLLWHICANRFDGKIVPHNVAASDAARKMRMPVLGRYDRDAASARVFAGHDDGKTLAVAAAPLDSLFSFRGRNIAIKMDVEGHECAAINGAENLFAHNRILLQVEVWPGKAAVITDLLARGFSLIHHHGNDFYFVNTPNK